MSKTRKTVQKKKAKVVSQPKKLSRSASSIESRLSEPPASRAKRKSPEVVESPSTAPPMANDVVALMFAWSPVNLFLRQQATFASMFARVADTETADAKRTAPRVNNGKSPRR